MTTAQSAKVPQIVYKPLLAIFFFDFGLQMCKAGCLVRTSANKLASSKESQHLGRRLK